MSRPFKLRHYVASEHAEQSSLITWVRMIGARKYPELKLLHSIPNGGERHPAVAAKLKAEGLKAGVCDLFLPVARRGHHGIYLEMKRRLDGRLTEEQIKFINAVIMQGYAAYVVCGWEEARDRLLEYLSGD
jgi:VRR-NUC domain